MDLQKTAAMLSDSYVNELTECLTANGEDPTAIAIRAFLDIAKTAYQNGFIEGFNQGSSSRPKRPQYRLNKQSES